MLIHLGPPPTPETLLRSWTWDPWVLLGLGLACWAYARGLRAGRPVRQREAWCFAGGVAALFVALVSPLDAWGSALFSAHMAQHMVLMLIAAPLLVLGRPVVVWLWALPAGWRPAAGAVARAWPVRPAWRAASSPLGAWTLHALAFWGWHVPRFYEATLESRLIHALQHLSFFGSAVLFWWVVVRLAERWQLRQGLGVLFLFTTAAYGGVLGAALTFATAPWYGAYQPSVGAWGLSALEDQQLGGLIMWIPGGFVYLAAALVLLALWLRAAERRVARLERGAPAAGGSR